MSRRVFLQVTVNIAADVEDEIEDMSEVAAACLGLEADGNVCMGTWNEDVSIEGVEVLDSK